MITDILSQEWNNERLGDIQDALQALLNQMVTDIDGVKSKKVTDINLSTEGTTLTATVTFSDETEASASVDIQDALNAADIAVDIVNNLRTDNPSKALSASMGMELNRKACVLLEHMHLAADTMLTDSDLELNEQRLFFVPTLNRIYAFDCHAIGSGLVNREVTRDVYPPRFGVVYYDLETATAWRWDGTNMVLAVHPPYFMIAGSSSGAIADYNPIAPQGEIVYPRLVWFSTLGKLVYFYMDGNTRRYVAFDPDPNRVYVRLGSSPKVVQWSGSAWVDVIDISSKANDSEVVKSVTINGTRKEPTSGNVSFEVAGGQGQKGDKGDKGDTVVVGGEEEFSIVNDTTTGGASDALSAEMGKRVAGREATDRQRIDAIVEILKKSVFTETVSFAALDALAEGIDSISFNASSHTFDNIGDTFTLNVVTDPAGRQVSVTWSSDDTTVATVNNGVVTAVADGDTVITATTTDGKTATCAIKVKSFVVESITLNTNSITSTGEVQGVTHQLTATTSPAGGSVQRWTSSDDTVATVDNNGRVTIVGDGTCTITASADEATATCSVIVSDMVTPSITLNENTHTADGDQGAERDGTFTLAATTTPSSLSGTIEWSSSDPSVATVSNGVVTIKKNGTTTITATFYGKTASCVVTVQNLPAATEWVAQTLTVQSGYTLSKTLNGNTVSINANSSNNVYVGNVTAGDKVKIHAKWSSGTFRAYVFADSNDKAVGDTVPSSSYQSEEKTYEVTVPAGATKVYINWLNPTESEYAELFKEVETE